jgi:uncharacterized protein (TIGR02996 family)
VTTEDDFRTTLDANPEDWQTRLVYADWLQDRGDPRAEGYRALGTLRRWPRKFGTNRFRFYKPDEWLTGPDDLPADWWNAAEPKKNFKGGDAVGALWNRSRSNVEDAAALAFAKLPPERRAELLTGPPGPKNGAARSASTGRKKKRRAGE